MMPDEAPSEWPWDRLMVFAAGCVAASIGTYVIIFFMFQRGLGLVEDSSNAPLAYGFILIGIGIFFLGAPWANVGPLARRWNRLSNKK